MEEKFNSILDIFCSTSCLNGEIPSLDTVALDSSELKSTIGAQNNFQLYNFTSNPINFHWINYEGHEEQSYGTIHPNQSQTMGTFVNHVFNIYYISEDKEAGSFYLRIPEINFGYIGDFVIFKSKLKSRSWSDNLHEQSLEASKFLSSFEIGLDHPELILIDSYFYDNSSQTQSKIFKFLSMFNKEKKFIDPFFNPLNEIDPNTYKLCRIGEISQNRKLILPGYETKDVGESFNFTIKNDSSKTYTLYWIDYEGHFSNFATLEPDQETGSLSGKGHSWVLKNGKNCLAFRLGEAPFLKSDCNVLISKITRSIEFDHDIESEHSVEIESCIFDRGTFHEDSAKQGCIGKQE
jgi:hypothetical protein